MTKRTSNLHGLIAAGLLLTGVGVCSAAATLLIDDFDRGEKPNALGGDFGSWDKDPNDPSQKCAITFDKTNAFGGVGYSLKIDYDVDSPNPAYNGMWMDLKGSDLSQYKKLTFYIKGDPSRGYTNQIKLEIKNGKETGNHIVKGISDQWQQVSIPLSEFKGISDLKAVKEFVVVFDDLNATKKVGTIYLDEILFES
jgi:endo-beta-N-acetylglucosaminidase D